MTDHDWVQFILFYFVILGFFLLLKKKPKFKEKILRDEPNFGYKIVSTPRGWKMIIFDKSKFYKNNFGNPDLH